MKSLILHLKENWQVFVFAVIGLLLVLFPAHVAGAAPYIIGVCSLLYAAVNIIISLVSGISIIVSMILAALLMMDPFAHFTMHIKILGLEMISSAFIRRRKGVPE